MSLAYLSLSTMGKGTKATGRLGKEIVLCLVVFAFHVVVGISNGRSHMILLVCKMVPFNFEFLDLYFK